jgi:IS66 Orf2 like protein
MLQLTPQSRIFLATDPVDFRKGIAGLAAICRQRLGDNPLAGAVYVFRNRAGTSRKLLLYDGQGYWRSSTRQNTTPAEISAGHVTIIDPAHPLYGRRLPLLRVPSVRTHAGLVVQLPDGQVRRIPRAMTDLTLSSSVASPPAVIAVPTLRSLAQLICATVRDKEEQSHDPTTTPSGPVSDGPISGPPLAALGTCDVVDDPGLQRPKTTGTVPVCPDPADTDDPERSSQGVPA